MFIFNLTDLNINFQLIKLHMPDFTQLIEQIFFMWFKRIDIGLNFNFEEIDFTFRTHNHIQLIKLLNS